MLTNDTPGSASADVLALLREQCSLYEQLESLARRQHGLVTKEDVSELLSLLAKRQKLSERLHGVATKLAPTRRDWVAFRETLSAAERIEADRLLGDAENRLRRVIEADEQDARVLSGRKQAVAASLRATHVTDGALSAYGAVARRAGRLDCVHEDA